MQTFLPYPEFVQSLICLDYKRLGKQRVEAKQILDILLNRKPDSRWRSHPAVRMWRGHETALQIYYNICLRMWENMGYKNSMAREPIPDRIVWPSWLGNPDFHASHRSNLLRKDPVFYGKYGWTEPDDLPYVWPNGKGK